MQMSKCLAIIAGICITFGQPVVAEHKEIEPKVDQAIALMRKAVEEAEKGNFILGSPYAVCPGQKAEVIGDRNSCEIPAFACRCF